MKIFQSIFLTCIILFTSFNLQLYQNWCHGENIGFTINSKKFELPTKDSTKPDKETSFKRDYCCKDVLIKSDESSFFSPEKKLQFPVFSFTGVLTHFNWNLTIKPFLEEADTFQLYSNPPPPTEKLYKLYCNFTFYS